MKVSYNLQELENFVNEQLVSTPHCTDVIHDLLAFLAEQMIEMNKVKQAEIKGFVSWLERETGAKVEDLSNKTTIREYYNHSFEDLVEVLKKNKNKFAVDPSRREFQEKVKAEFESSVSKLKPLMKKIELTDNLIDQIVYKLYGLTKEEIKIVEASFEPVKETEAEALSGENG